MLRLPVVLLPVVANDAVVAVTTNVAAVAVVVVGCCCRWATHQNSHASKIATVAVLRWVTVIRNFS